MSSNKPLARRCTSDGKAVLLWPDGLVTFAFGFGVPGVGRATSPWAEEADVAAGWLAMGDVELYDAAEVGRLVAAARRAVRQTVFHPLVAMRRFFAGDRIVTVKAGSVYRWECAA